MKKILLLGANGQVGWELQRSLSPLGQLIVCDRQRGDLQVLESLERLVRTERPDVIVNAGAYTAVDKAEGDIEAAPPGKRRSRSGIGQGRQRTWRLAHALLDRLCLRRQWQQPLD